MNYFRIFVSVFIAVVYLILVNIAIYIGLSPNKIAITFPNYSHKVLYPIEPTAPPAALANHVMPAPTVSSTEQPVDDALSDVVSSQDLPLPRDAEPVVGVTADEMTVVNKINALRSSQGLKQYAVNNCLERAANERLDNMTSEGYFSHTSPEGLHSNSFILNAGYHYKFVGENLARGFESIADAVEAWKTSPTHYANILDKDFTDTGVAINGDLIVQLFASGDSLCK